MMNSTTIPKPEIPTTIPSDETAVETIEPRAQKAGSTLSPVAYDESVMPALRLVRSSRKARLIGRILLILLVCSIAVIAFAPWQQSIRGDGEVLAYSPQARPQVIEAPIKGRIISWGKDVFENAPIKKGQIILEIQDLDPELMSRLQIQLTASQQSVNALQQVMDAYKNNLESARLAEASYQAQLVAYREVKTQIVAAADSYIEVAKEKLKAEEKNLEEFEAALAQEKADYERQKQLYEEKIVSQLKFQMAERKYKEAIAKTQKAEAYIEAARDEVRGKQQEREAKAQKAQVEIDDAQAKLQKAIGEIAKAASEVAKAESELNKAVKDQSEMETKLSRQESQIVRAPLDGTLLNLVSNQGGAILKEGDTICTIVPNTDDRAVELWISGNDVPLVQSGDHVRLQFEGWPAVQFTGWPSVAVGTFGGKVISVDRKDNHQGKFRCLVLPDETSQVWPEERFLRQGVRANGWILLKQVPLWYELWRNMNGFPLVVDSKPEGGKTTKSEKSSKLSKPQ